MLSNGSTCAATPRFKPEVGPAPLQLPVVAFNYHPLAMVGGLHKFKSVNTPIALSLQSVCLCEITKLSQSVSRPFAFTCNLCLKPFAFTCFLCRYAAGVAFVVLMPEALLAYAGRADGTSHSHVCVLFY